MVEIKKAMQSSHLNFLFGSGLSMPFLQTLGNIEQRLTELDRHSCSDSEKEIIRASVRKHYFEKCIKSNTDILAEAATSKLVMDNYKSWLGVLNQILLNRKTSLLKKHINLFTTNMDIFAEMALEAIHAEFNDGFYGRIRPSYGLSNFKKSIMQTSQQYGVAAEVPIFNLYKLHGSVNWQMKDPETIVLDRNLEVINNLKDVIVANPNLIASVVDGSGSLLKMDDLETASKLVANDSNAKLVNEAYDKLVMINPTKDKFRLTTLNKIYYELLRMFSNELERENAVLFVMGFSFADEHITEIVKRAVKSNPTLNVYVFAFNQPGEDDIKKNLNIHTANSFNNIHFVPREKIVDSAGVVTGEHNYTLEKINSHCFLSIMGSK